MARRRCARPAMPVPSSCPPASPLWGARRCTFYASIGLRADPWLPLQQAMPVAEVSVAGMRLQEPAVEYQPFAGHRMGQCSCQACSHRRCWPSWVAHQRFNGLAVRGVTDDGVGQVLEVAADLVTPPVSGQRIPEKPACWQSGVAGRGQFQAGHAVQPGLRGLCGGVWRASSGRRAWSTTALSGNQPRTRAR